MLVLDVNTNETIEFTAKLEKLNRSAYPSAVRNTLNNAAFDMKKSGMLESAKKNFSTVRSPIFFKRFTAVNKADGFDVNSMRSVIGFVNSSDPSVKRTVDGLEKQEKGGTIDDGSRYLKASRGGNYGKRVQRRNYYDKNKVISGRSSQARGRGTRKSKFVSRMFRSKSENKPFFINSMRGNFLVKTTSIRSANGRIRANLKFLMMSRDKTPVKVRRTSFVSDAANEQAKKMPMYFKRNAEYQFKKYLS